ncbi:MAG: acyl-CoA carboxylase subunit beta [Acidobacteria bacterium]|nr:acyl-CoA carboxylase subunit beta [Acidobacteriota bacterium]
MKSRSPRETSSDSDRGESAPLEPRGLRRRAEEVLEIEERLRAGGGPEKIERQHKQGKWTARERVSELIDPDLPFLEIGLLVAYDLYEGAAPAAGVVTGIGYVEGQEVAIVANDATVKAGAWWPETIRKILRMQEIAMRNRIPIIYLVDSAGVNLPYQSGVFPGAHGAGRIFYYNSLMRRILKVPQISAVMGPCIAGGAYLPALSDVIIMVEGTSFMGLGGPNLVKGATGQSVDGELLGGARTHTAISGVAHYLCKNDRECIQTIRKIVDMLPQPSRSQVQFKPRPPGRLPEEAYDLVPDDHRQAYEMRHLLDTILDGGELLEFQPEFGREMITGHGRIDGIPVGVLANYRGLIPTDAHHPPGAPKLGGIIYTEGAEKSAEFIETCDRQGTPLLFLQDVSGFMVGKDAEHSGIIRAGARMVEAMATAGVPRIVLTLNHASGAGYYAMAGQGFEPDFIFCWPTARMGVMEGESAVQALFAPQLEKLKQGGESMSLDLEQAIERTRADYELKLDARYAAARGFVDAIITPETTREVLALALRTAANNPASHTGPFDLRNTASHPRAYPGDQE